MEEGNVLGRHCWQSSASSGGKGECRCPIYQLEMGGPDVTALEVCERETGAIIFPPRAVSFRGIHGSPDNDEFNKV